MPSPPLPKIKPLSTGDLEKLLTANMRPADAIRLLVWLWEIFYKEEDGTDAWNLDKQWESETVEEACGALNKGIPEALKNGIRALLQSREMAWRAVLLQGLEGALRKNFPKLRVTVKDAFLWTDSPDKVKATSSLTLDVHWLGFVEKSWLRNKALPPTISDAVRQAAVNPKLAFILDTLCAREWNKRCDTLFLAMEYDARQDFVITVQREESVTGKVTVRALSAQAAEEDFINAQDWSGVVWDKETSTGSAPCVLHVAKSTAT